MEQFENKNGITIKQLKELVKNLPEVDPHGEDYEVWITTYDNHSSPAIRIIPLNKRKEGQDLLFEC